MNPHSTNHINLLSLIIMVYNERPSLDEILNQCLSLKGTLATQVEIIFVDDGSVDGSKEWISEMEKIYPEVVGVYHPTNKGIGHTLYSGYQRSSGDWVAILPGDLQFKPKYLELALPLLSKNDIICFHRKKRPDYSVYRKIISYVNNRINQVLFGLKAKDVNWVKIYKKWVIKEIDVQCRTPFIESERLIKATRMGAVITEIDSPYYLRSAGLAKGARLKTVLRSIKDSISFLIKNRKLIRFLKK